MAIDSFAKSLIADAKKKNKERERDELKNAFGSMFGTLIGSGIKSVVESKLEQKKNAFLQNEQVLATKLKYKSAVNDASTFLDTQKKIRESGKNAEDYFFDVLKPLYKETALTTGVGADNKPLDAGISGNERLFQLNLHDALRPKAKELAEKHREGLKIAQTLGEYKDFNTFVNTKIKNVRPENLTDAAVNTFRNLFSGKSTAEQEEEVLKLIRSGVLSTNAKAMADFNEEYKNSRSAIRSFNFMDALNKTDIDKIITEEPDEKVTTTGKYQRFGNADYFVKTVEKENLITGEKETIPTRVLASISDSPEVVATQLNEQLNIQQTAEDLLTPSAYSMFVDELIKNDINILKPKNMKEYALASTTFNSITTEKQNLKDPFKNSLVQALISAHASKTTGINSIMVENTQIGTTDNTEAGQALMDEKIQIGTIAEQITQQISTIKDEPVRVKIKGFTKQEIIDELRKNDPNITDDQIEDFFENSTAFDKSSGKYIKI